MSRVRKRRWHRILVPLAVLVLLWVAGLFGFVDGIPTRSEPPPETARTDAIVVLTGGRGRVARGTDLLASGVAERMLISGVGANAAARDLIPKERLASHTLACCVTLGRAARNTRENAVETAGWVAANRVASLRLVTADFHIPRSLLEFRAHLPQVEIVADPVTSENVRLARWWRWPGTAVLLAGEYNKYLAARARLLLTRPRERN
jgi:uncharacterized SAM-binding protein YcdF (DUF218 family)